MTTVRTYERTHPWINFGLNLERLPAEVWILLGEARSKCDHLAGAALRPDVASDLHTVYFAKGVQGTTAIEGNTLTEQQVEKIIRGELKVPLSQEYLQQEVQNVIDACHLIWERASQGPLDISFELICELNRLVLKDLKLEPEVAPGEIRKHPVGVFRYRGAPPEDCAFLLERLCAFLRDIETRSPGYIGRIGTAILMAVVAHVYLAWIHPFGDGNGRTARLVELAILLEAGVPTPAAHLLSNHYNMTRGEYCRQLDMASKSGGNIVPFILYAMQGFVDGFREQLAKVRNQQLDVVWRNYVHERFKDGESSQAKRRCKHLVLDLTRAGMGVAKKDLRSISQRVIADYHGKTERTLTRDINMLKEMNLLVFQNGKYRARVELIAAFLPDSKHPFVSPVSLDPDRATTPVPAPTLQLS